MYAVSSSFTAISLELAFKPVLLRLVKAAVTGFFEEFLSSFSVFPYQLALSSYSFKTRTRLAFASATSC